MSGITSGRRAALALRPRDGMLLKDGRGWFTSESGRAGTFAWPAASTVRGAVTAAVGHAAEEADGRPLSAAQWLAVAAGIRVDAVLPLCSADPTPAAAAPLWPAPRDAVTFPGEEATRRLRPAPPLAAATLPLAGDDEAAAIESLWHPRLDAVAAKPDTPPAWWTERDFVAWLCDRDVSRHAARSVPPPPTREQTHVAIGPTGAALDGALFTATVIEPVSRPPHAAAAAHWSLAAIGTGFDPARLHGRTVRLGGDGRCATLAAVPEDFAAVPPAVLEAFGRGPRGLRLVLVGDASFAAGWRPAFLEPARGGFSGELADVGPVVLRAACVGRPVSVSGWRMVPRLDERRPGPKPTRRLAPAGSVYFLEKASGEPFTAAEAERLWLRPVGESVHDCEPVGAVVPGVWDPGDVGRGGEA